jgi:hypothetical protein
MTTRRRFKLSPPFPRALGYKGESDITEGDISEGDILALLACQNEFDPPRTDIECSLFKPPHYLHACTKNLPNMKGFVRKTTNSLPKVMLN